MQMQLECIPCFMSQSLRSTRMCTDDPGLQRRVLQAWAARLGDICDEDMANPPPALARQLYGITSELTGCVDPYKGDKEQANARVMEFLPRLTEIVDSHTESLRAALAVAIVGNFIDSGVAHKFDWEGALNALEPDADGTPDPALHGETFDDFVNSAAPGARVLILGDNAGEIGLDTLLVRHLVQRGCQVTYAVRGSPVLNDATEEDARFFGMHELCTLTTSGVDTPGTVLSRCRPGFLDEMRQADVICSKGQGNFESLHGSWPGVFYAFKAKCQVVSRLLDTPEGASVFMHA